MKKCLLIIFLILGTVIGSGFSTGKEIAVFFSRFGYYSVLFIHLVFVMFYFTFYFLMRKGSKKTYKKSRTIDIIMIFCATIFSSAMFAGIENCGLKGGYVFYFLLLLAVLLLCLIACFKKLLFLSKVNLLIVPLLLCIFVIFFFQALPKSSLGKIDGNGVLIDFFGGGFYSILYVVLNISLSSVVIASSGDGLTKKQIKWVSFFASLILSVFIFVINYLLLCNYDFINVAMPLLSLSSGIVNIAIKIAIIFGCLTTLLSMIYISANCCKRQSMSHFMTFAVCVALPFLMSVIGFSSIISWLYPIASFLGVFLLFLLFFKKEKS